MFLEAFVGKSIYFNGEKILEPSILEGRFFGKEDFKEKDKIVIGKEMLRLTNEKDNKRYIRVLGEEVEVIGVMGSNKRKTAFDNIFYINNFLKTEIANGSIIIGGENTDENINILEDRLSKIDKNVNIELENFKGLESPIGTVLYNFIYINEEAKNLEEKFNNSFKENMYVIEPFIDVDDILSESNLKNKKVYEFHNYLKENENLKSLSSNESYILTKEFEGYEKFLYTNNYAPNFDGIQTRAINSINIDYGYIKNFDIKTSSGENLNEKDFNIENDIYPILLGDGFKNIFNIADEIEGFGYYGEKIIYKVKGFLQKGYYDVGLPLSEYNIKSLDKSILVPFQNKSFSEKSEKFDIYSQINKSILTINSEEEKKKIIKEADKNFGRIKMTKLD